MSALSSACSNIDGLCFFFSLDFCTILRKLVSLNYSSLLFLRCKALQFPYRWNKSQGEWRERKAILNNLFLSLIALASIKKNIYIKIAKHNEHIPSTFLDQNQNTIDRETFSTYYSCTLHSMHKQNVVAKKNVNVSYSRSFYFYLPISFFVLIAYGYTTTTYICVFFFCFLSVMLDRICGYITP